MTSTLITADQIVTLDAEDHIHESGFLLLDGDRIDGLGPRSEMPTQAVDERVDLGARLVMPGLVNAHTHTPMVLFRGLGEGHSLFTLEGWYNAIRVVEQAMDPAMVPAAVEVSCAELIRTGTTCFADQYFWMDQVVPAVRKSGLRAALAYGIVELGDQRARVRELAAAEAFLGDLQDDPRLTAWVGPHAFFVDNREDAMHLELELVKNYSTGFHIHLATSGEEDRFCQEAYGISAIARLDQLGILEQRILAAHCLTLNESDFAALSRNPFTAVIAASSCMRNAAQPPPLKGLMEAGVNLALGTDNVVNNNSYDMFKEMQIIGKLMSLVESRPNAIPTRYILEMATMGGARGLGLDQEIGSLEPGKRADLISLDLAEIGWAPTRGQDVYTAMVYGISGMHVRDVMVDGRWLYRNGSWTTLDYPSAVRQLEKDHGELVNRMEAAG